MSVFRFALDEDVAHLLASLLRAHGEDAESAKELGRLGRSDAQVLSLAADGRQTLVTHNSKDFRSLHEAWIIWSWRWTIEIGQVLGRPPHLSRHAGILIVPHLPNHDLVQILEEFADANGAIDNRLFAWNSIVGWQEPIFSSGSESG